MRLMEAAALMRLEGMFDNCCLSLVSMIEIAVLEEDLFRVNAFRLASSFADILTASAVVTLLPQMALLVDILKLFVLFTCFVSRRRVLQRRIFDTLLELTIIIFILTMILLLAMTIEVFLSN